MVSPRQLRLNRSPKASGCLRDLWSSVEKQVPVQLDERGELMLLAPGKLECCLQVLTSVMNDHLVDFSMKCAILSNWGNLSL